MSNPNPKPAFELKPWHIVVVILIILFVIGENVKEKPEDKINPFTEKQTKGYCEKLWNENKETASRPGWSEEMNRTNYIYTCRTGRSYYDPADYTGPSTTNYFP